MKVSLTYPYCWPEVRRGGERLFHDLGVYLSSQGIDVRCVSTGSDSRPMHPLQVRHRAFPDVRMPGGWRLDRPVTYLPLAAVSLAKIRPDLVHGLFHLDGVAARLARPFTGKVPYVVHVQGMPKRENLERLRAHKLLFGASVSKAAAVIAVSRAASEALYVEFGVNAVPVLNGIFTDAYSGVSSADRDPVPTEFFPADPNDPRKRVVLLAAAMRRLDGEWRSCRLAVAGEPVPSVEQELRSELGDRVSFLGWLDEPDMVEAYGRAWVTCLPAVREAFGLVIVESLAAGRPCVAVRDGGVPEILSSEREQAWLASPDDADSLAEALTSALGASLDAATEKACRDTAAGFDWSVRGQDLLAVYRGALER